MTTDNLTKEDKIVWNAAIEAATKAIEQAPIFPPKGSPAEDAERINIISICRREVTNLRLSMGNERYGPKSVGSCH